MSFQCLLVNGCKNYIYSRSIKIVFYEVVIAKRPSKSQLFAYLTFYDRLRKIKSGHNTALIKYAISYSKPPFAVVLI